MSTPPSASQIDHVLPDIQPLEPEKASHLAELFKALSDPTRLRIISLLLAADEVCVHELEVALNMTQTAPAAAVASGASSQGRSSRLLCAG
jgi:ArsR family transcriptional regulator